MEKYDENGPLRGSFGEPSEHDISESLLLFKNKRVHVQSDISSHFKLLHILLFSINIIAFVVLLFSMRTRDGRSLVYCKSKPAGPPLCSAPTDTWQLHSMALLRLESSIGT